MQTIREMLRDRGLLQGGAAGDEEVPRGAPIAACVLPLQQPGGGAARAVVRFQVPGHRMRPLELGKALAALAAESAAIRIFVVLDAPTDGLSRAASAASVEVFNIAELQFNPSQHELVPRHERVPAGEVPAVLEALHVKSRAMLPCILRSDPIARYYGLAPGDVVRITRRSATACSFELYRVCV